MRRLPLLLLACVAGAAAQETPPSVITEQRGGIYVAPPASVDPVYTPSRPNAEAQAPAAPPPLSLQLTLDVPLRHASAAESGPGVQGSTAASPTVQAQLRWLPVAGQPWFARLTFYRYLQADRQQPWHPDFSYAFGYDDGRPRSWSLFYANYTGTRFQPDAGEHRFNFPEGQWTLAYRFALPAALEPALLVGDGDAAGCSANAHLTPRFTRVEGDVGHHKKALSLGCRYTRPEGLFAEAALFAWPQHGQQQPWDPDFTYGFGYARGSVVVKYSNYSGNRFPGRARGPGEGTFRSGSISVSWSTPW
jgi:hypothetical protein